MDDFFPILVILIVFGFVVSIIRMNLNHQSKKLKLKAGMQNEEINALLDSQKDEFKKEIQILRERIEILEKIVTDDKYELKKEFEKLDVA